MVFLLIDEQRKVLYVEFESAEKYTRLLQNTRLFPMDNYLRQLHVHFGYISLRGSNVLSKIELYALTVQIILLFMKTFHKKVCGSVI